MPLIGPNGPFSAFATKIKRRDDLIPSCVALDFSITGTWNGQQYCQTIRDVAGTIAGTMYEGVGQTGTLVTIQSAFTGSPAYLGGSPGSTLANELEALSFGFEGQTTTLDMEGGNSTVAYCTIKTMPVNFADPGSGGGASLPFWQSLFPELATQTSPAFASGAVAVSVVDDAGNAGTIGTDGSGNPTVTFSGDNACYSFLLTDGQIAPWMLAGNTAGGAGAKCRQCTVTATFTHTENNVINLSGTPTNVPTSHVQNQPKHARLTLVSIAGGTYSRQSVSAGEVIPYGVAGYIYNIEKIPQYEGTFTLQETEITDQVPPGNNLNLSGSLAEWATMAACVQHISYDLEAGRTTLTFGPAAHLGAKDFVERLRVNRPPRWYNLQNQNPTNDPTQQKGTQLGNNVAQRGPNNGAPAPDMQLWPVSLSDAATHAGSYATGIPGVTKDARISGQPNYGNIGIGDNPAGSALSAPTKPCVHLQDGGVGAYGGCVRIAVDDAKGLKLAIFEYPCCFDFKDGNGPVPAYVRLLGCKPYKTSLG